MPASYHFNVPVQPEAVAVAEFGAQTVVPELMVRRSCSWCSSSFTGIAGATINSLSYKIISCG